MMGLDSMELVWWEQFCLKAADLTAAALLEREREFARQHTGRRVAELTVYLKKCAEDLGYTPHPAEIVGSEVILRNFANWNDAIVAAGLTPIPPGLEPPPLSYTALYRAELQRQWLLFKGVSYSQWKRRQFARAEAKRKAKLAKNKLEKELNRSSRQKQEREFAQSHATDSDQELYEFLKSQKRRRGKNMSPVNTVGYQYITQRLGPWRVIMGRVNAELKEERRSQTSLAAVRDPPDESTLDPANNESGAFGHEDT